jgi:hypothetical protein
VSTTVSPFDAARKKSDGAFKIWLLVIITTTLSAADATADVVANPVVQVTYGFQIC